MKLILNDKTLHIELTPNATLGEALKSVSQDMLAENEVVSMIWVDGDKLTAEQLHQWHNRPATEFKEIKVDAPSKNSLAVASLQVLTETIIADDKLRKEIVAHIHEGHSDQAMAPMSNYLQQWNSLHLSIESVCNLMDLKFETLEIAVPNKNSDGLESNLLSERLGGLGHQLGQIKEALEAQDMVLLGDILEYEFADMITDWRNIIAELIQRFSPAN